MSCSATTGKFAASYRQVRRQFAVERRLEKFSRHDSMREQLKRSFNGCGDACRANLAFAR